MGQKEAGAEPLATVLSRWIRRERLRPGDVERASGVSRNHLWLMMRGKISRPTPETLRKLATALATDPDTGEVDELKRADAFQDLALAAGWAEVAADVAADDLVRAIRAKVGNLQEADFWADIIETYRGIPPTKQQLVRAVLALYTKPGGDDVVSLLLALSTVDGSLPEDLRRWLAHPRR